MKNILTLALLVVSCLTAPALSIPIDGRMLFNGANGSLAITALNVDSYDASISGSFIFGAPITPDDAPLLTTADLTVHDGHGYDLTAKVGQFFLSHLTVNNFNLVSFNSYLSDFAYSGTQPELVSLSRSVDATVDMNAYLTNGYTLNRLTQGGRWYNTSFTGSIDYTHHVPDSAKTGWLLIAVLFVLVVMASPRFRS